MPAPLTAGWLAHRSLHRAAAGLAALSAGLHVAAVDLPEEGGEGWLMLALAAACGVCALRLWRRPGHRAWVMLAVTGGAMLTTHLLMMNPMSGDISGHMAGMSAAPGGLMRWATLVAGAETAFALTVLVCTWIAAARATDHPDAARGLLRWAAALETGRDTMAGSGLAGHERQEWSSSQGNTMQLASNTVTDATL